MRASCSPTIGPRRTITGPRAQWEVCIQGEETLGTSLRDMSAPARESKRSGSVRKATALGAPHAKKKRRLNGPDEKRGRAGGGDTQSQAPAAARRSQGQQERPTRGRGGQKARRAMTSEFEEVTGVEQGRGTGSRVDDTEFGQQTQLQYDALDLFDYGDAPPLSPSPTTALQASASLQHTIEDDVSDGGNAAGGPVSRVQGRQLGGRAMQSAVVFGSVGGRGGGGRTQKTTNVKRWGWDRSSEVRTLFAGDPARPGHPLRVETENKLGDCVLKIRCRICRSLISYHNSSWTSAATHIRSHNIATAQDIAAAAALLLSLRPMARPSYPQAANSTSSEEGSSWGRCPHATHLCCPVLRDRYATLSSDQADNCEVDCSRLPSIQDGGDGRVQGPDKELGSKVSRLR